MRVLLESIPFHDRVAAMNRSGPRAGGQQLPLSLASKYGHLSMVALLLESGALVNFSNDDGQTALLEACAGGHAGVVRALIQAGADVSASTTDSRAGGLMLAAQGGHAAVIRVLFDTPATAIDPATPSLFDVRTHIHRRIVAGMYPVHAAAALGHLDAVRVRSAHTRHDRPLAVDHCFTASLPHCLAAPLPRCLTASLPHCLTASLQVLLEVGDDVNRRTAVPLAGARLTKASYANTPLMAAAKGSRLSGGQGVHPPLPHPSPSYPEHNRTAYSTSNPIHPTLAPSTSFQQTPTWKWSNYFYGEVRT